ncbi:multidrug transport system, ATPase and permease components [Candidatus Termititenax persephonae]|uniref:Multidrug transport system, ATPase and permease components n=1 Tax=Candidatus Termititenax persephonae TaxID=2218525 RepID=A0A388TE79_9BACT|nr:multidrug transport system, ATPase and permease components [Candidatus Termititenax persephonae]
MSKTKPRRTGMARLWELAFQKKALTISACFLSVASVVVSFAPFVIIYYIIRELALHYADLTALNADYLLRLGWLAGGSAATAVLLNYAALMCSHWAAYTTLYKLKLDFTRHLAALPLGFHTEHSTGQLRKIVDENIEKLEGFIAHQLPDLAGSFAMPLVALLILFWFDWRLGLASFAPILLAYFIQASAFGNKAAQEFIKKYQDSLEELNNAAVEYVRGITVVKAFNQTIFSFRKFYATIKNYGRFCLNYTLSFEKYMVLFMLAIGNVYVFLLPAIIWLADSAADYAQFALSAVFYLIFSVSLATPFLKLLYVSQTGQQIADGVARMDKMLDAQPLPETKTPLTVDSYSVSFRNVTFAYNSGAQTVPAALTDVSFTARQGEVTALVGPSGGGKSTIAQLIPRFYDAQSGAVKIGGVNIRDMANEYLLSIVSFVFQEVFLFKQSVADNILIGNKNASRAEVIAAAQAAQCHEFVQKLPQGYDTVIGARNIHLSGGERQRLVLARAILKNAPILVLDEATAFADPENEHKIQLALEKLMRDKTVIIIAHRLSTVRGADKILVLDRGKIVEEGTPEKLAAAQGLYSRMWAQYASALNWTLSSGAEKGRVDV